MKLAERIHTDTITAMKGKDMLRLSVLRMAKTAITVQEKQKMRPLTEEEVQNVLISMVKQRVDSEQQFASGGRPELAAKEGEEIALLQEYLPRYASDLDIAVQVAAVVLTLKEAGTFAGQKSLGDIIRKVKELFASRDLLVDGKKLSDEVKAHIGRQ